MSVDRSMTGWFLKTKGDVKGPLTEAEMRAAVEGMEPPDLCVRQGESDWYPADIVRSKLETLKANGVFIRFKQIAEGPFTLSKAYDALTALDTKGVHVRMGRDGAWVKASKWIAAVDRLKRKEKDAVLKAVSVLFESGELFGEGEADQAASASGGQRKVQNSKENGVPTAEVQGRPSSDADDDEILTPVVIEEEPPTPNVPAAISASQVTQGPAEFDKLQTPVQEQLLGGQSLFGSTSHGQLGGVYESNHPRARITTASAESWGRIVGFTLAAMVFLMLGALIASGIIRKNSLRYVESSTSLESPTQSEVFDIGQIRGDSVVPNAEQDPGSAHTNHSPTGSLSSPASPPLVTDGMLFRPTMKTAEGVIDAGTAFAATVAGSSKTFVVTALHLFGPAGGLDREMSPAAMPLQWQALTLRDCKSRIVHDEVSMNPVLLEQTQPLPTSSPQGDVAACAVEEGGFLRFKPLEISSDSIRPGEKVWLVSEVSGRSSLVHSAVVVGIEEGWAVYQFDQPIDLRATSGAPIVDGRGQVVAVHAGGGDEGGHVVGVGTPTVKFASGLIKGD